MSIEERLAAAERRIADLERRLGPAPVTTGQPLPQLPPIESWSLRDAMRGVSAQVNPDWPHNAGSRA